MSAEAATAEPGGSRRDFLTLIAQAGAAIGGAAVAWTLIDSMEPSADVIAAGAPIEVDLKPIAPGQQIVVLWRGSPILIVRHTPAMQATLRQVSLVANLLDPNSEVAQQPPYAQNWHRSLNPEYVVMVGICTHLGCLPGYLPTPSDTDPVANWPGGYLCPCHGSKYDLVGRVYKGVPAPYNLPVPPYHFTAPTTIRIGANPPGVIFDLTSVVQM
ncbi:MAG TPA: ubiquinol-cytochrome c reductase iron-sulfur subunit [Acetobacteraceae bacterium]|jgi:ubiquinol-cytochrome c reductase iron-sulfur subunit|nr:ubiquinol-cytochrome c reductase iron-sulfur subunit [Acetobacteraceae bacterium]